MTENGFVRILGHTGYLEFTGGTGEARAALRVLTDAPGHQFWIDDLSLTDEGAFLILASSKHLTDQYLLALAVRHGAKFVTLDERIDSSFIVGGSKAYFIVPELGGACRGIDWHFVSCGLMLCYYVPHSS